MYMYIHTYTYIFTNRQLYTLKNFVPLKITANLNIKRFDIT